LKGKKSTAKTFMFVMLGISVVISITAIILMFTMKEQSMLARKIMFSSVIAILEVCYIIKFNIIDRKNAKLNTAIMTILMIALAVCLWIF